RDSSFTWNCQNTPPKSTARKGIWGQKACVGHEVLTAGANPGSWANGNKFSISFYEILWS
ncbi:unnamed protein product, partial [Sphenostylis stenocarpa]